MLQPISLLRLLKRFSIAVACLYLIACIALYFGQGMLTYFPRPLLFKPDARDIEISAKDATLHGWVVNPGQQQALIYFGGNGESVERDIDLFRRAAPASSVYLVPYRGFGANAGKPTEAGLFADALVIDDWVRTQHAHVSVMGRSLGSGIATWVASRRPTDKLVLVTPFDSILNIARERYPIFPVAPFLKDRYESWRYAESVKAKVLVVLASDGQVVPRTRSEALIAHFPEKPEVVVIPHSGHNNIHDSAAYVNAIANFMRVPEKAPTTPQVPQR
jgi:pimeloyl-ACP methyl ester carboxylesterase